MPVISSETCYNQKKLNDLKGELTKNSRQTIRKLNFSQKNKNHFNKNQPRLDSKPLPSSSQAPTLAPH